MNHLESLLFSLCAIVLKTVCSIRIREGVYSNVNSQTPLQEIFMRVNTWSSTCSPPALKTRTQSLLLEVMWPFTICALLTLFMTHCPYSLWPPCSSSCYSLGLGCFFQPSLPVIPPHPTDLRYVLLPLESSPGSSRLLDGPSLNPAGISCVLAQNSSHGRGLQQPSTSGPSPGHECHQGKDHFFKASL